MGEGEVRGRKTRSHLCPVCALVYLPGSIHVVSYWFPPMSHALPAIGTCLGDHRR